MADVEAYFMFMLMRCLTCDDVHIVLKAVLIEKERQQKTLQ